MNSNDSLKTILVRNKEKLGKVIDISFKQNEVFVFDFTVKNEELNSFNIDDIDSFSNYVNNKLKENNCKVGAGGYLENRIIYKRSRHFGVGENSRIIHMGIDLWADAGTNIISPLDGFVHSFKLNNNYGDYGPTIILQHELEGLKFYTLYGHLSLQSLEGKQKGMKISKDEIFAQLGNKDENGFWAPHLHFQLMTTMLNKEGDFPGVAALEELDYYKSICIDPNYILQIEKLK